MSFVRTVLGDMQPEKMGLTYSHEHVIIDEGFSTMANPDFILNDTNLVTAELKEYYQRRIEMGKSKRSTINIIRNKIIHRMFAVIKRQTPFVETYLQTA